MRGILIAATNPKKCKNADGTTSVSRIHRYTCYSKVRHRALCTGHSDYTARKIDEEIDRILRGIFAKLKDAPTEQLVKIRCTAKIAESEAMRKQASSVPPRIEVTPNTFKTILPNMNTASADANKQDDLPEQKRITVTPQMKAVLDYLTEYWEMGEDDLMELLNEKRTSAYIIAKQMADAKLIIIQGRGETKRYLLAT